MYEEGEGVMAIPIGDDHDKVKTVGEFVEYVKRESAHMVELEEMGPTGLRLSDSLSQWLLQQADGLHAVSHDQIHRLIIGHAMLCSVMEEIIDVARAGGN